jgi:ferritin
MKMVGNTIRYTGFEVTTGYMFDQLSGMITTKYLHEQSYWEEIQRLKKLAQSEDDNDS